MMYYIYSTIVIQYIKSSLGQVHLDITTVQICVEIEVVFVLKDTVKAIWTLYCVGWEGTNKEILTIPI